MTDTDTTIQKLARFETARFGLEALMANCSRLIQAEEAKPERDQACIDQLKVRRREYRRLRNDLDFDDRRQIEDAIATYGPQAKAALRQTERSDSGASRLTGRQPG
ncbi:MULTISPECIES: hypothetical protein [Pseudomonas]|uniref:Uncharacterized protein n=1 Tax=Pseudomonas flavocrustae TaxID=2991719 RepID=A0ABT6IK51_9PSED|nr:MULTISPECIES: hypothetical protein [unclassified Pseudomonas]MDH4764821.1 hypothetical protein [Pseudomonas sp. CBMAI 2609]